MRNLTLTEIIEANMMDTPDDTARAVMNAVSLPQKWRDLFGSIIRDECRRLMRAETLAIIESPHTADHDPRDSQSTSVGRVGWLSARISLGGEHGYRLLGEMTVEDHLLRIDMMTRYRNGIQRDIDRHQGYIDELRAAGAATLFDLYAPTQEAS